MILYMKCSIQKFVCHTLTDLSSDVEEKITKCFKPQADYRDLAKGSN